MLRIANFFMVPPEHDERTFCITSEVFRSTRVLTFGQGCERLGAGLNEQLPSLAKFVEYPFSSLANLSITPDLVGNRLQCMAYAAYPTNIPRYLNIGM